MLKYPISLLGVFLILAILLTACSEKQRITLTETSTERPAAELANPASVNCEKLGGSIELREGEAGQ
jgi:putative hemolysin